MNIAEIRQNLEAKKGEVRSLYNEGKIEEAENALEEKRKLEKQLKVAEELEEEEKRELEKQKEQRKEAEKVGERKENKELEYRALVKHMMGKNLTEEERAAITTSNVNSNTGAIIPSEFINKVDLIRSGYVTLKNYCDVIPVTSDNGKMPTSDLDEELADLEEDKELVESMLDTKEIEYKVKDLGLLKSVGNSTLEDSAVAFIDGMLAPNFAVASVNKENKMVCSVVNTNSSAVTVGADTKVEDVLAKTISKEVPTIKAGLVIITNGEGYSYIDNLKDATGRKDDRVTERDGKLFFKNKEVIEMADKTLPALSASKTMVFYVVNLKTVKFFDRKQVEIARSTEAGFTANKTLVRAIERADIKPNPYDKTKAKKIEA